MQTRININGVTYGEDQLISVTAESIVMGNECPACGNACAATITVDMLVPEEYIPQNAKMVLQVSDDGTTWADKGVYWIDTRSKTRNASNQAITLHLEGFDSMIRAERDYTIPEGAWVNMTDAQLLAQICSDSGITSDWTPDKGYIISSAPEDLNGRQLIGYLAGMYGGNAVMSGAGHLKLVPLSNSSNKATLTIAEAMTIGDQMPPFTAVTVHDMLGGKYTATAASNTGAMMNIDCPWATQAMANDILSRIFGFSYRPYELQNVVIPAAIETGDTITFHDLTAKIYSLSLSYGRELVATISAPDRNECVHDYQSPAAAGGGGGGGSGGISGAGKATSTSEKLRVARKQLIASVDDVSAGLDCIASVDDRDGMKAAQTTMFAKVFDPDNSGSVVAQVATKVTATEGMATSSAIMSASVGGAVAAVKTEAFSDGNGHTKTLAQIIADDISLQGRVDLTGVVAVREGGVIFDAPIYAIGEDVHGENIFCDAVYINQDRYAPQEITSTSGAISVLAV